MEIYLMNYDGFPNTINKRTTIVRTLQGAFRNDYSLMNPSVDLDGKSVQNLLTSSEVTYVKIENMYYFIQDWNFRTNGMVTLELHLDVLMTYQSEIMDMRVITKRTSNVTTDVVDRQFPVKDTKLFEVIDYPKEFDETEETGTYIMVTAQTGYTPVEGV